MLLSIPKAGDDQVLGRPDNTAPAVAMQLHAAQPYYIQVSGVNSFGDGESTPATADGVEGGEVVALQALESPKVPMSFQASFIAEGPAITPTCPPAHPLCTHTCAHACARMRACMHAYIRRLMGCAHVRGCACAWWPQGC